MGTTILYSSGDDGVAGDGGACLTADGEEEYGGTIFVPGFPAACPYITSVGATQVNPGASVRAIVPQVCEMFETLRFGDLR